MVLDPSPPPLQTCPKKPYINQSEPTKVMCVYRSLLTQLFSSHCQRHHCREPRQTCQKRDLYNSKETYRTDGSNMSLFIQLISSTVNITTAMSHAKYVKRDLYKSKEIYKRDVCRYVFSKYVKKETCINKRRPTNKSTYVSLC